VTTSPTFVATFADDEVTRMTTFQSGKTLNFVRGVRLARVAYASRMKRKPSPIVEAHYEREGQGPRDVHARAAEGCAMTDTIYDVIADVVTGVPVLEQADADNAIDALVERIITVLRRDPQVPTRSAEAWRLLFADATARSCQELGDLIEGKGDLDNAVNEIIEALEAHMVVPRRAQKRPEAGATVHG
jgi:hypothetical protein